MLLQHHPSCSTHNIYQHLLHAQLWSV